VAGGVGGTNIGVVDRGVGSGLFNLLVPFDTTRPAFVESVLRRVLGMMHRGNPALCHLCRAMALGMGKDAECLARTQNVWYWMDEFISRHVENTMLAASLGESNTSTPESENVAAAQRISEVVNTQTMFIRLRAALAPSCIPPTVPQGGVGGGVVGGGGDGVGEDPLSQCFKDTTASTLVMAECAPDGSDEMALLLDEFQVLKGPLSRRREELEEREAERPSDRGKELERREAERPRATFVAHVTRSWL
jgi:hypothetical protein